MDKKIVVLFITSIIIFVSIILGINILIKKYSTESAISPTPSQGKEQSSTTGSAVEKKKALEPQEEPERELPIQSKEPLLN